MAKTKIEWVRNPDGTPGMVWNPVSGCSKVSEGCRNCYAESLARRFRKDFRPWTAPNAEHNVRLHPERLEQPLQWSKPRRVFVNSVSDLFHEQVPDEFIEDVLNTIAATPRHTYQVLTKREKRMMLFMNDRQPIRLKNLWLGISAEDQPTFDERVQYLLQTPAAKYFVSLEPLLGPVDVRRVQIAPPKRPEGSIRPIADWVECDPLGRTAIDELGVQYSIKQGLDWVIVGGESGPGARPMHPQWVRDIRDQCQVAGVPFWFKQWGAWAPCADVIDIVDGPDISIKSNRWHELPSGQGSAGMCRVGKKAAGNELDGKVWEETPDEGKD